MPDGTPPVTDAAALAEALRHVGRPLAVVDLDGRTAIGYGGAARIGTDPSAERTGHPLMAYVPAILPEHLGDSGFRKAHGLRYAYVAGAMANGITSERMVEAMGRAGMLGFFGSAGLDPQRVTAAIVHIQENLGELPYGFNLIHSPSDPQLESTIADLYLQHGVRLIEASAYLDLTLPLVRYRLAGIHATPSGEIVAPNKIVAKVSRIEVARKFLNPPPTAMLNALVQSGFITTQQAGWAERIPMADDLTAEADSGGHTDNRPALALLPTMLALRDEIQRTRNYAVPPRIGAAGGVATPASVAAAFAMGAAYVLTGTVNQACLESGTSPTVREMLAQAGQADVIMAPAADMFEMGVKVQVLKWGTMFAIRARKLYDLYRAFAGLEQIPVDQRTILERDFYRCTLEQVWEQTARYFTERDPGQIARAQRDPKHKMALVFRAYLGQSSRWAINNEPSRKADYQVWCGPAMGAFNEWTAGSFLADVNRRDVVTVAMNLLVGAAALSRSHWLRAQGVRLPAETQTFRPRELAELDTLLQ
ncbi:MAG: PfaD family polyunsaturated fatty acid/polyketide biosynthesis protein [Phycisphaerales bacterium]|nr:PfaD family polyunsaturated fatty acid/polyketide biosynthesis protein [Phycisphaerales bacterium]